MGFTCSVCGGYHEERMLDVRLTLPGPIFALDEEERDRRAQISDDMCSLDDGRFFLRGLLEIPIPELHSRFAYGAWVELRQADWQRAVRLWDDPAGMEEPPFSGYLTDDLAPYAATSGLAALLQLEEVDRVPSIEVVDRSHPLGRDQLHGITIARSDELAAVVLH
jgi:hypothetical protein